MAGRKSPERRSKRDPVAKDRGDAFGVGEPRGGRFAFPRFVDRRPAAVVEIGDRGPGMSPELQAQLFNPFFTTKDGGTGLGLPISLRIVEEHGGAIEVQSRVGEGTAFRVLLPLQTDEAGSRP